MIVQFPGESRQYRAARDRLSCLRTSVFQGRGTDGTPTDIFAEERGWRRRLRSSSKNIYNRDHLGETADGAQMPMLNGFHRDGEVIRHFWGAELTYAPMDPGQDHRSVGTLEPLWNLLDLTLDGRPAHWDEQLSYS